MIRAFCQCARNQESMQTSESNFSQKPGCEVINLVYRSESSRSFSRARFSCVFVFMLGPLDRGPDMHSTAGSTLQPLHTDVYVAVLHSRRSQDVPCIACAFFRFHHQLVRPFGSATGADKFLGAGRAVGDALAAEMHPQPAAIARDHALPVVVPTAAHARDLPVLFPACVYQRYIIC